MTTLDTAAALFAALQQLPAEERAKFAALYAGSTGAGAVVLQLVATKAEPGVQASAPDRGQAGKADEEEQEDEEEADLSVEDASDYLGVSAQVLRRYIKAGQLKASRGRPGSPPLYPMAALRDLKATLKR